jgi:hypothetical protein
VIDEKDLRRALECVTVDEVGTSNERRHGPPEEVNATPPRWSGGVATP